MEKLTKIFKGVTRTSTAVTFTATILSIIGMVITGFYPGIVVYIFFTLIPIASNFYANKTKSVAFYTKLIILNLLVILIVFWMTFVIMIDRVIPNIWQCLIVLFYWHTWNTCGVFISDKFHSILYPKNKA